MKALKLAVAEPSAILRYGIVALLRRMPAANVDILEIGDTYGKGTPGKQGIICG